MRRLLFACTVILGLFQRYAAAETPHFQAQEIDPHVGEICYAVSVADVNRDQKLDVVAVTEDAVVWYENPSWRKSDIIRKATARDNVCIQPHDIDGDGRIDFALGAGWRPPDTKNPSTLQWLGRDGAGRWQLHPIRFDEPTLHRLRWGDVKGTGTKQLVVAALQGRGTKGPDWGAGDGVRIVVYDVPRNPDAESWPVEIADSSLHTVHNLQLVDTDGDGRDEILAACWEGVFVLDRDASGRWTKTRLGSGNQDARPSKGSSEVKIGRLSGGATYVATIEPWHGYQVVVYTKDQATPSSPATALWSRRVIAEPLQWGHAVWTANLDGDDDDELIIGQRDPNKSSAPGSRGPGVFVFDPKPGAAPLAFERHTIDDGGMACEDALAADLDGDGRADIIAGGRATHNVKIYWNRATDPSINEPFKNPDVKEFIKRFESDNREVFAERNEIVAALGLAPGMAVADVGAGTGLFTRLIADKVGKTGRVYAVDIAASFLAHIAADAQEHGQTQVVTVQASQFATNLPAESVDLVFLCDVYHHLEDPQQALASIRQALRPGGGLVVIDFDRVEGRSADFVLKHVRAGQAAFRKEIEAAGFSIAPAKTSPALTENFFLRFEKTSSPKPSADLKRGGEGPRD
jgi:ubiquinone/menaquinone biosynthesis C-methylase UbiE